jgi:hypothetical protein
MVVILVILELTYTLRQGSVCGGHVAILVIMD